jgi:hypothetical protein
MLNVNALHTYVTETDITPEILSLAESMGGTVVLEVLVPVSRPGDRYEVL